MREDSFFYYWICDFGHFYEVRESNLSHGGISKIFFLGHFSPSLLGQNCIFGYRFHFESKNDVWFTQVSVKSQEVYIFPSIFFFRKKYNKSFQKSYIIIHEQVWLGNKLPCIFLTVQNKENNMALFSCHFEWSSANMN